MSQDSISLSMSQPLPTDQVSGSQEPPIYTETPPLIWIDVGVSGRWIEGLRRCPYAQEAVPITPHFYASLHKVSRLVATRLTEPDGLRQLSESSSKWDGLSGLLLYVTTLIFKIHHGMSLTPFESS